MRETLKKCGIFFDRITRKGGNVAKKIVITSGKGGVGKTTVTANVGRALASLGARVVMVDVDFGLNNLEVVLGVESKVVYSLVDAMEGRCRIRQALVEDDYRKNLFLLVSGNTLGREISGQNLKLVIESLSGCFDYVLLDCPAGIDVGFYRAVSCCDSAIVVTTPFITSIKDAHKVITILKSYKLESIDLIVNRARGDLILDGKMIKPLELSHVLKTNLIGVLPEEDQIFLSNGICLPKFSESYKSYKFIAENVYKNSNKIFDVTKKYTGFLGSLKRSLRKSV